MIELVDRYTREEIQENIETLYVFGDNMTTTGYGGQAAAARGEPNAVGIPTKFSPAEYFTDDDYGAAVYGRFYPAFLLLRLHLQSGGKVVWPADDIGTGLADLENQAPRIWKKLQELKHHLFEEFQDGESNSNEAEAVGLS